jgi:hypothetical protein
VDRGGDRAVPTRVHLRVREYPRLTSLSVGFLKNAIVRPVETARPKYVAITLPMRDRSNEDSIKKHVAGVEWNMLWESGQYRRRFFDEKELTPDLSPSRSPSTKCRSKCPIYPTG